MDVSLGRKEGWVPKNWYLWIVMLEKILESSLDSKEIKPVNLKENQSWIFIGRIDAEVKLQYFGHLMWRSTGEDPDSGQDWKQKEKRAAEDEMVR